MNKNFTLILIILLSSLVLTSNTNAQKTKSCIPSTAIPKVKGMNYHDARKLILKNEWIPSQPIYPKNSNPVNFWGVYDSFKAYPEVQGCSGTGTGPCVMFFTNQEYELLVVTTDSMDDPKNKAFAFVAQVKTICW